MKSLTELQEKEFNHKLKPEEYLLNQRAFKNQEI